MSSSSRSRSLSVLISAVLLSTCLLGAVLLAGCGSGARRSSPTPLAERTITSASSSNAAAASSAPSDPAADEPLIDHVRWITNAKGLQLQVYPTAAGRTDQDPAASVRAWTEILADSIAARPSASSGASADSPGMRDQFLCHWNFARLVQPDKPSWNLEPWRPAVGYPQTVAAMCNPGGSEG